MLDIFSVPSGVDGVALAGGHRGQRWGRYGYGGGIDVVTMLGVETAAARGGDVGVALIRSPCLAMNWKGL